MDKPVEDPTTPGRHGIKWDATDEEAAAGGSRGRPRLSRAISQGSIHSVRSRASSAGPTAALPIQYRTLSIDVEDYQARVAADKKGDKKKGATADLADLDWHAISVDELTLRLSTSLRDGLSGDQVTRRTQQYGKNKPAKPQTHKTKQIIGYLFGGFGSVLLIGGILVFAAWKPLGDPPLTANLALAIVLVATFAIQAAFNVWQDWSSSRVMDSIRDMLPEECLVTRDGQPTSVPAADVVPGDVVVVRAGSKLPADMRFCEVSSDAKFDRSILTGESAPLGASVDSSDANYLETRCIGLQGSHCVSGTVKGLIVATGSRTVFGRIAALANQPRTGKTPLEREVLNFVWIICSIMALVIVLVIVLWAAWLRKNYPNWITVPNMIISCVSVAVAFIPEGLPIAVTASLTISANLMRRHKVLCKSLKTVETLGSVSVICSDKTGTLTQNRMVVTGCLVGEVLTADQAMRDAVSTTNNNATSALAQLRTVAALCNAGEFDAATLAMPLAERRILGNATDQAILRFSEGLGLGSGVSSGSGSGASAVGEARRCWKTHFDIAFNSKTKYMIRVLGLADTAAKTGLSDALPSDVAAIFEPSDLLLTIKGAPEILLKRCTRYISRASGGGARDLDASTRAAIERTKDEWSAQGRRVLLLARKVVSRRSLKSSLSSSTAAEREIEGHAASGLTLVGLVAIADPPRPEIPEVIATLRGAGIRVFMVTGDFALTAQAIAQECGIITAQYSSDDAGKSSSLVIHNASALSTAPVQQSSAIVLSGSDLQTMLPHQWDKLVSTYNEVVFARTTPEQKLRIVRELQSRGHVVGMTGDGANDAPALRAADVGIAMAGDGGGSDIASEAADMVLLDSFAAIIEALRYGRSTFDNLKKTIAYLLPAGSFSEFWPIMTNVAFGIPQILGSFLMIVICCFTDCLAAIALAYEKPEADVLTRPPRVPGKDRLVDWKLIVQSYGLVGTLETLASFAMSYWYLQRRGFAFNDIWFSFNNLPASWDTADYARHLKVASSIYFVNLVVMQWFNLLAVRTRRLSILQHPPLFRKATRNSYLIPSVVFSLVMVFFWCYIPPIQAAIDTAEVPVEFFFLPMAFGMVILLLDEARKYWVRNHPKGFLARIAW